MGFIDNAFTDTDISGQAVTIPEPIEEYPSESLPESLPESPGDSFTAPVAGYPSESLPGTSGEAEDISAYIDVDTLNRITTENLPYFFGIAFASATVIVLLTYGVIKAISLIRIKK